MSDPNPQNIYDEYYYATGCGLPYRRDEHWMTFFGRIAEQIVSSIAPKRVLDAGCALGLLVEQLHLRGVEVAGIDISEYAINSAPESIRALMRVGSIAEPFGQRYDLIVCIEVLEHMPCAEAEQAVINFCQYSDDILFSSSPLDFKEATHCNVHPIEYWADLFARQGFVRDVDYDASFLTPWAIRFRRSSEPQHRIVRNYERRFWELWKANTDLRELAVEQRKQIEGLHQHAQNLTELHQMIQAETQAHSQAQYERLNAEHIAYTAQLEQDLAQKIAQINELKATIERIEAGRIMRIMRMLRRG
ncbi:class I SAM-dependent methyltransferase [Candidatus Oscillochloris fontis]|uniref:class I SAM-dependent methyltransferase n=1 Tax=Candidatus Oscillochloris fontis TaxID=2496868 RepID=UPI00101DD40F|nr:class I SAM-dependent methyltransferase [Candidatus Oscillochloris fontis]